MMEPIKKKLENGFLILLTKDGKDLGYMVPTEEHVRVIESEFRQTGRTPTDIIDKAIEILREEGCHPSFQLANKAGTNSKDFIIFKQAEPKAGNMLKMIKHENRLITFIRGPWKDERGLRHPPTSPRPIGTKTITEVPVIPEKANETVACYRL